MEDKINRRDALKTFALTSGVLGLGSVFSSFAAIDLIDRKKLKNNINHSVCRWPYNDIPLETFAAECRNLGLTGMDLLTPSEWETAERYGIQCTMATDSFASITDGFNEPRNHQPLQEKYKGLIDKASEKGIKNVICFSGNRRGLDKETGLENCAVGLTPLLKYAEERKVNLVMELLNSKVNHPDYQCDHTTWGVALVDKIGMPNFKLLYDIYHMQIMEGDVIATITKYKDYIDHYHTGGVPGRHEINDSQELNYAAIMRAIVDNGFDGYVAQEFVPTYPDKIKALKEGIEICDV
ncbi:MAG: TIM barrel protein [Salegentibacter sp.]